MCKTASETFCGMWMTQPRSLNVRRVAVHSRCALMMHRISSCTAWKSTTRPLHPDCIFYPAAAALPRGCPRQCGEHCAGTLDVD
jgi:hypothetical protein